MASAHRSLARRLFGGMVRLSLLGGMRAIEVDPAKFRAHLAEKHGLHVRDFDAMHAVPLEQLDAIAAELVREAQRLALAEGAGFGLGGAITLLPDISVLTVVTLRLIQRLCLLYGFQTKGRDARLQLWLAAAGAAGMDYGKEIAGKQAAEKLIPRLATRLAVRLGEESAEKWLGRLIPLASSVIGGALNYGFVRGWGRRVQGHLRARHVAARSATPEAGNFVVVAVK
jgi:uncharacterized protein (DUF697 family)